jgi:hypothetical protein
MAEGNGVTYTVKELLAIQAKSLERIEQKVDDGALRQAEAIGKLDTRVTILEQRPDLQERVRVLEDSKNEQSGERAYRRWLPTAAGAVAGAVWWLPQLFHHP